MLIALAWKNIQIQSLLLLLHIAHLHLLMLLKSDYFKYVTNPLNRSYFLTIDNINTTNYFNDKKLSV